MTLDPKFAKRVIDSVEYSLVSYKVAGTSSKVGSLWGCKNMGDFMCGFFTGEVIGSTLGVFQMIFQREPTPDERQEIIELVESHAEEIKECFMKFN